MHLFLGVETVRVSESTVIFRRRVQSALGVTEVVFLQGGSLQCLTVLLSLSLPILNRPSRCRAALECLRHTLNLS